MCTVCTIHNDVFCWHAFTLFLTIVHPTVESTIGSRISVLEGYSVTLSFRILNANPTVTSSQIRWYFNNSVVLTPLNNLFGNTLMIMFSNNLWNLIISNVNYNIQGRISMVANNVVGSDTDFIDLIVEGT